MGKKEDIELIIYRNLMGSATDQDRAELHLWLNSSEENRLKFREYNMIFTVLNPSFDPEKIDLEKAHSRVFREIKSLDKFALKNILYYWQRLASILILPLGFIFVYFILETQKDLSSADVVQNVTSPHGMTSQIDLPDGSKVWLNGGSQLTYSLNEKAKKRVVKLNGEAYFEVFADKTNPFIVTTDKATVTAIGTAFNVEAYNKDSITAITMTNGHVDVVFGEESAVKMKAGDRIYFNHLTAHYELTQTDSYKWCAWKDGLLIFRDDPLAYVFKRLEIMFNVEIKIKDQSIAQLPYRATFEGEPFPEILHLLEMTAPIHFYFAPRKQNSVDQFVKPLIEVSKGKSERRVPPPLHNKH